MKKLRLLSIVVVFGLGTVTNAFDCVEKGVFKNTDDINNCNTYIICDASLQPSVQYCTENTYYWPLKKGCFSHYDCATESMPDVNDNENPCDGFSTYETIRDKYSTDCSSYLLCFSHGLSVDNELIQVPQVRRDECGNGKFKPGNGCVDGYECTDYECTTEGLFENPNVIDCSNYVKCKRYTSRGGTGTFLYNILKTCPSGTKYNPFLLKCDSFYDCDVIDPHNGIDPCEDYYAGNPFVENPHANDCKTFIECLQTRYEPYGVSSMNVIVKKDCPPKTYFSPNIGNCYYNHRCNQPACSKDPCRNGPGKFIDYRSGHCRNFIECRDDSTTAGEYRPTYEKRYCPPGALFSPTIFDCDADYVCPPFPVDYCYETIPTSTTTSTSTVDPD